MSAGGSEAGSRRAASAPPLGRPRWGIVVLGYLAALLAGWGYGAAIRAGGEWHQGAPWERTLLLAIDGDRPAAWEAVLYAVPWVGTNLTLGPLIAVLAVWLIARRRRDLATWIVTVELGVLSMNWLVKQLLPRERPDIIERVGWFGWGSYPSGHAMASLAVGLTLAALVHRMTGRRWPVAVALALAALNAYSRLVHGVHWPTDVVGGLLVGVVWLAATWFAFVRLPGRRAGVVNLRDHEGPPGGS